MGNYTLEIFKFGLYVTFPVLMFYGYNQASFFEGWVAQTREEMYKGKPDHTEELLQAINEIKARKEKEMLLQLEKEAQAANVSQRTNKV